MVNSQAWLDGSLIRVVHAQLSVQPPAAGSEVISGSYHGPGMVSTHGPSSILFSRALPYDCKLGRRE